MVQEVADHELDRGDPRYTLTDFEREEVLALKTSCDEVGIDYDSIFELAKYCLVSSSIQDTKKRRADSLNRLKKKRAFEKKHDLESLEVFECVKILQENMPDWAVSCGKIGDKQCVGYSSGGTDPGFFKRVQNALEIVCKVEFTRYDLAAADLEEARRGFVVVGSMKGLKANPISAARMGISLKVLFDKMNANRIKNIYAESPRALAYFASMVLNVFPKKIRERVDIAGSISELKVAKGEGFYQNVPSVFGGEYDMPVEDWIHERMDVLNETKRKVVL
uniref:CRAL-TRIO domain-containing protein n=1 Tax=Aplanochytrium stocchinoi TaxID=215587 RepID=A0A7S3LLT9_9STRA|mmetsp:Transcript_19162/g.23302  ORF Transcript_19162/g.23302 Transcript_19162/m.23302 type:complete len:278 (+) Transcript_19162:116-949(+)|eukprot:CAMPEP_0204836272 /NCGR_PEP_ID=MMETSP1346-20131115/24651_1 /ASSEMBLY_ACC=CAM_ASM_000771 /TAXON_ID=215587 /ORGANISM="Aplanochytrium stocchinoi, Strain GSBS06" /LENGTH=277 /DNA_ID=CAMNT_0051970843 /DNA_START=276 /DNA_END=1109 /DNA_ORIENTATION=-